MRVKDNDAILSIASGANDTKRRDVFLVDPKIITIKDGHNVRDFETERVKEHISALAENIRENGVQTPLECYRESIGKDNSGKTIYKYTLIDGECRYRAVDILLSEGVEIDRIPVILARENSNEVNYVLDMLNANESLRFSPLELAYAYQKFINWGWDREKIAKQLGKSLGHVNDCLELLGQTEYVQKAISEHIVTANVVRKVDKKLKKDGFDDKTERREEVNRRLEEAIKRADQDVNEDNKKANKKTVVKYFDTKETQTVEERVSDALELVLLTLPKRTSYSSSELEEMQELLAAGHKMKQAINHVFGEKVEKSANE